MDEINKMNSIAQKFIENEFKQEIREELSKNPDLMDKEWIKSYVIGKKAWKDATIRENFKADVN